MRAKWSLTPLALATMLVGASVVWAADAAAPRPQTVTLSIPNTQ